MDKLTWNTKRQTEPIKIRFRNLKAINLGSLLYADDIILIANNQRKEQSSVNPWTKSISGNRVGDNEQTRKGQNYKEP
ncbi:hypothetical protein HHI36_002396, partial [Cryptolaemus montrouzieri]